MPCYRPLKGYRSRVVNPSGKRGIVFNVNEGYSDLPVMVPCGQCIGCRLEKSRQWAIRCMHEASLYDDNCFLTLTYDQEHLPEDGSLHVEHFQKFMKRLRKKYSGRTIRFFHCGEYGEKNFRPHYHAIIFNFDFPDKRYFQKRGEFRLYTSEILHGQNGGGLWPYGHCLIGSVTFESAGYVARYVLKKLNGDLADVESGPYGLSHYQTISVDSGEIFDLKPEYTTMSRRPGIGKGWYDQFKNDVYPSDHIIVRGKKCSVPKFYDNQFEIEYPDEMRIVKAKRKMSAGEHDDNNTADRLYVREQVKEKTLENFLPRHKDI